MLLSVIICDKTNHIVLANAEILFVKFAYNWHNKCRD